VPMGNKLKIHQPPPQARKKHRRDGSGRQPPAYKLGSHAPHNPRRASQRAPEDRPPPEDGDHAHRTAKQQAHWREDEDANVKKFIEAFPEQQVGAKQQQAVLVKLLAERTAAALERAGVTHCATCPGGLQPGPGRNVVYQYFCFRELVTVPSLTCLTCNADVTVHAYDVGCQATGPRAANCWIDTSVVFLYKALKQRHGVSVHGKPCRNASVATFSNGSWVNGS